MYLRQVLADAATLLGRMSEYRLLEHVRREQLRRAGDDDARATALNNLGSVLHALGRLDEVEPLFRQSLEIQRKALGPEHADVGTSLNNLGMLLQDLGRLDEAELLCRECLEIERKTLGPEHPEVATSLNNLGKLLRSQGRLDEAEPLFRQSLEIRRKALRPEHADVGSSLSNPSMLLQAAEKRAADEAAQNLAVKSSASPPEKAPVEEKRRASLDKLGSADGMETLALDAMNGDDSVAWLPERLIR